ncbi:element excision factor XisH family protein [Nostoc sp.]
MAHQRYKICKEALGQYDIYRYLLEEIAPERKLYLAVGAIA